MNKNADELVTAIGAMAEISALLYKQLIGNGFEHKDAIELVKVYIATTLTPRKTG